MINVILSGGVGSRLWPLSRKSCPKQYVKMFDGKSLFQLTVLRNAELAGNVMVVGNRDNSGLSEEQLKDLGIENADILVEATPRNTAPAIAFAALHADADDILLVTPSDHIINKFELYKESVERAAELAAEGNLVTFGLRPTRAETGYGYIEYSGEDVKAFKEKPDAKTAQQYLESGNYLWNSGIFCFRAGTFLEELGKYRPEILKASEAAYNKMKNGHFPEEESLQIPSESIDYAVMEQSDKIKVVPSDFSWSDLGSFESLYEYFSENGEGRFIQDKNLVMSNKHVEIIGLENISVIETEDALLILPNSDSQKVKGVFERLEGERPGLVE